MSETAGEKTEAPTPKRKEKARDDGQLLKSREFAAALIILIGCGWLVMMGPALMGALQEVMITSFSFGRGDVEDFQPFRPLVEAGAKMLPSLGALLALTFVGAIISQAGLGALRFNSKLLAPKGSRINPGSGLKRMFGSHGWIELGKSLLKAVLLLAIGAWILWDAAPQMLSLVRSDIGRAVGELSKIFYFLVFTMAGGLLLIAGIDVPVQIVQLLKKMRMSKQEVRDEHKQTEGSPELKAAMRQRQHQMAKRNFRTAVGEAHVVLTNPTHFAVALRYDQGRDQVPVVVAKGRGEIALAIRELATELAVPTLEYPTLARAVYYTSREGQEVRDDLYMAIATVLAFVFGVNVAAGGRQPDILVPEGARFDENGLPTPAKP